MSTESEYIDRLNYYSDRRTYGPATPDGVPTKWEICGTCQGDAKTVNPSIDAGGLSGEDFDNDLEFFEDYMSGAYDVPCNSCSGLGRVKVADLGLMDPAAREAYEGDQRARFECEAERRAELIMGA